MLIHESILDFGGIRGVREDSLLEASLGQPQQTFGGEYLYDPICKMAACYLFSFAKNHAFLDGNKRVAAKACYLFLYLNDIALLLNNEELFDLTSGCVENKYDIDAMAQIIRENIA